MQLFVKTVWQFPRGLNRELLNDPAGPLLGMYPGEITGVYIKSSMKIFIITAFFIIAQSENSPIIT